MQCLCPAQVTQLLSSGTWQIPAAIRLEKTQGGDAALRNFSCFLNNWPTIKRISTHQNEAAGDVPVDLADPSRWRCRRRKKPLKHELGCGVWLRGVENKCCEDDGVWKWINPMFYEWEELFVANNLLWRLLSSFSTSEITELLSRKQSNWNNFHLRSQIFKSKSYGWEWSRGKKKWLYNCKGRKFKCTRWICWTQ